MPKRAMLASNWSAREVGLPARIGCVSGELDLPTVRDDRGNYVSVCSICGKKARSLIGGYVVTNRALGSTAPTGPQCCEVCYRKLQRSEAREEKAAKREKRYPFGQYKLEDLDRWEADLKIYTDRVNAGINRPEIKITRLRLMPVLLVLASFGMLFFFYRLSCT
jgi:hypothetical protein